MCYDGHELHDDCGCCAEDLLLNIISQQFYFNNSILFSSRHIILKMGALKAYQSGVHQEIFYFRVGQSAFYLKLYCYRNHNDMSVIKGFYLY